jgi:signal transduction histidine kinase
LVDSAYSQNALDGGGHVALHSDVTRHKDREIELADEIRRLQADRDRAAALVADLELSLSLLRGGAEKLRLEAGGRNGLAALADDLRIAVKRGDEVLLDLAEVTADEHQLIRPVNLNDLLVGLQPLLESTAGQSVESELRIDNRVYDVELDANAFGRLILELAARARDVMTDGGMMVIGSANVSLIGEMAGADGSASGPHVMISLADEGPGLSDAEIAAVLDHPVDDEAAKDENIDPLIAARRFVCQSGGVTRLESTAEDGTTIELYFPRYFPAG